MLQENRVRNCLSLQETVNYPEFLENTYNNIHVHTYIRVPGREIWKHILTSTPWLKFKDID